MIWSFDIEFLAVYKDVTVFFYCFCVILYAVFITSESVLLALSNRANIWVYSHDVKSFCVSSTKDLVPCSKSMEMYSPSSWRNFFANYYLLRTKLLEVIAYVWSCKDWILMIKVSEESIFILKAKFRNLLFGHNLLLSSNNRSAFIFLVLFSVYGSSKLI